MNVLKKMFRELIKDVDPSEISKMEQTLIDEGMPESEVKRLCDVHVEIFKESLEKQEIPEAPPGHPVHTFMKENREAEKIMDDIEEICERIIMINKGKLLYDGPLVDLKKKYGSEYLLVIDFASEDVEVSDPRFRVLSEKGFTKEILFDTDTVTVGEAVSFITGRYKVLDLQLKMFPSLHLYYNLSRCSSKHPNQD